MTRLTRTDFINWADTKESEGLLPELIRRLIIASNQNVEHIVMPYGDSVGRSGLDGSVCANIASNYIALGESVWEFGTNKNHVTKANKDLGKRTTGTAPFRQRELTYYCVTPRHWEKKADWETAPGTKKNEIIGHWKQIHVYDVDDLLGWLSNCPSVEAWFSRKLGKATAGLRDVDGYWKNVATTDSGVITPRVLLAGREDLSSQVQSHFTVNIECPKPLAILSRSPAEVVPFTVAAIIDSGNEAIVARTIVVDSRTRWEQLIVEESALGLIVTPQVQPTREELQQAFGQDHRVIYCSESGELKLTRLSEYEVSKALIASNVSEGLASQHAKQCGGNGQLLLDRLSGMHASVGTIGSCLDDRVKVACLLLVAWDGEHTADREIVSILSGMPYKEIEASLVSDSNAPDGLLFRADGKYRLLSPELAWSRYAPLITKTVIEDFADIVRYLLADDDPTVGMSGTERLTAQFLGKRPEFSGTLRRNVVHSLAIASSLTTTRLNLDPSMSPSYVDWIVRSILEEASFSRWASFGIELSILAEAAPDIFLEALERDLKPGGPLQKILDNTETGIFSSPTHTGILWALERVCWSPDYLECAISILLRMAALKPDIKSGNNPVSSIRETLQLYCPQTNADWEVRQRAITRMLEDDAETAFPLIISLFPDGYSSWMNRETPAWRDWAYSYESGTTYHQIGIELHWCVEQLLLFAGNDAKRWCDLIKLCGDIDDDQFDEVLNIYESKLSAGIFGNESKRLLWETINVMLVNMEWAYAQRQLANGDVVDEDEIEDLGTESEPHFPRDVQLQKRFGEKLKLLLVSSVPEDQVLAGCHAFLNGFGDNHCSRHFSDRFDYRKQQEQIVEAKKAIAESIWNSKGIDGLRRLAAIPHVDADAVGRAVATANMEVEISFNDFIPLFSSSEKSDCLLANGFLTIWAWERKDSLSTEVFSLLSQLPSDETSASLLHCLPLVKEVWDFIDTQSENIQRLFWLNAPIPWDIPEGRLSYLVSKLIKVSRADRAIYLLANHRKEITENEAISVFEALEAFPHTARDSDEPNRDNLRWEIQELFKVLYDFGVSAIDRLLQLEILYYQIFEDNESRRFQPKALLISIRDSPSLFVDLLRYPWKNDNGESTTPDNDSTRELAKRIGGLLHVLAELPGESELCPMSDKTIAEWVAEVIRIATKQHYIKAVQIQLAKIIAGQFWKAISSWPTLDLADSINLLAEAESENFRRQLASSLSHARGVHCIDPTGEKEKSIATELRSRADQLQKTCLTAASALRDVAKSLDSEAIRNVERAEWEQ